MKYIEPDTITRGVTAKEIYSDAILAKGAPEGYEFTGNLIYPMRGDVFLNTAGHAEESLTNSFHHVNRLRLELRKVRRKQLVFTEIRFESQPETGEWYSVNASDTIHQWTESSKRRPFCGVNDFCTIYKREFREV